MAVHSPSGFEIYVLETNDAHVSEIKKFTIDAEATCIALGRLSGQVVVLVGILQDQSVILTTYPINEAGTPTTALNPIEFNTCK